VRRHGADSQHPTRFECMVKVGPRVDIDAEVRSFEEHVRFGVHLDERVEISANVSYDRLGAILYVPPGGTRGTLHCLDEMLASRPQLANDALGRIFDTSSWYSHRAKPVSARGYFIERYETNFSVAIREMRDGLLGFRDLLGVASVDERGSEIVVTFQNDPLMLRLPSAEFVGSGSRLVPLPSCLVHGNMHGGNVVIETMTKNHDSGTWGEDTETSEVTRVLLLDHRYSGPGLRTIDAAALECTIRIVDAERMLGGTNWSSGGLLDASSESVHEGRAEVLAQFAVEQRIGPGCPVDEWPGAPAWVSHVASVRDGVRRRFGDEVGPEEYALTSLMYCLRYMERRLSPAARLRLVVWASSLYNSLQRLSD